MAPSYGFFAFNNDGPHYIYLDNDDFKIGPGRRCDCRVSVGGWKAPRGKGDTICRIIREGLDSEPDLGLVPHLVLQVPLPVQLGEEVIEPKCHYPLKQGDIVRIPRQMVGNKVAQWLIFTYGDIKPGSIFAKYHFKRILGSGGFGVVHEAVGAVTPHRHAVKVIRKARCLPGKKDPIQNEVNILRALNHPYIVGLKSVFNEGSYLFLVMELATEGSVHDLILREGRLNESDSKLVVLDICSALTYLHSMAIVHRDIKPANILIRSRSPLSVKVSDFGLAKLVDGGTDLRTTCGTMDFMAPEIKPMEAYDHKVDTWAVGVTLFAMLCAQSPFADRARGCHIEWTRLPANTSKLGTQLICLLLTINPTRRPAVFDIPYNPWFIVPTDIQTKVASVAKQASALKQVSALKQTSAPKQASALKHAQPSQPLEPTQPHQESVAGKRVVVALVLLGVLFPCGSWGDVVFRVVALLVAVLILRPF